MGNGGTDADKKETVAAEEFLLKRSLPNQLKKLLKM
jgi:hypothetical protein